MYVEYKPLAPNAIPLCPNVLKSMQGLVGDALLDEADPLTSQVVFLTGRTVR